MIQKKQPVTKQFLLSFKSGHGDFYEKFVSILKGKVHFCRKVKEHQSCPSYMMAQKCIFMSILQRKNQKFLDQQLDITELAKVLQKYRGQILKSISNQKKCILRNMKDFKIEQMQQQIIELVTRQNFAFNSFNLPQNTYIYELFKAIFSRSEEVSMFGQQKYQPWTYSYLQIKQLCAIFDENIMFFDYNLSKSAATSIQFNPETTYILKVKDNYSILYVKEPKPIEIIQEGIITLQQLEKIFSKEHKKQPTQQVGFFDKLLGLNESNKNQKNNKLFPDQVLCSKCQVGISEFDCLKWNYEFFCGKCLQNPQLDTSSIPSTLIEKYFNQRGLKHDDYQIQCAQCTGKTYLRRYNPAKKPQKYKCQLCQHTICLQHNININECFCECRQCKNVPTINIVDLNLAVCETCKRKFCRNCNTLDLDFCNCICKVCFELKEDDHICQERCHVCRNHINHMKVCLCNRKICNGCYYYHLRKIGKNKFTCPNPGN